MTYDQYVTSAPDDSYKGAFYNALDTNDIEFIVEGDDFKEYYISIYTEDTDSIRELLTSDGIDILKGQEDKIGEYAETYQINFYTQYFPYAREVKLMMEFDVLTNDGEIVANLYDLMQKLDNVQGQYVTMNEDVQKDLLTVCEEVCNPLEYEQNDKKTILDEFCEVTGKTIAEFRKEEKGADKDVLKDTYDEDFINELFER